MRSLVGEGALGSVWLAERSDWAGPGVAAVKLLHARVTSDDGEARLRREGSGLAAQRIEAVSIRSDGDRSEAHDALRARAEAEAVAGKPAEAAETYRHLVDQIVAGKPLVESNVAAAAELSRMYASLSPLYHLSGRPDPKNSFIQGQLAAAGK